MKKGLVRQCAHHQALINEKSKQFVNLLFTGMHFGNTHELIDRKNLVEMIKKECQTLAGTLFDPSLLDLQVAMKKYAKNFTSKLYDFFFFLILV